MRYDCRDAEPVDIVPAPQDGTGKTMALPRAAPAELHAAPLQHLPVTLLADGQVVPPAAATDLWQRIRAHNRWLAEAYPAMVPVERTGYAPRMTIEDAAEEVESA